MKTIDKQVKDWERQVKDWERLVRICRQMNKRDSPKAYQILKTKLYEGVKKYHCSYHQNFIINKRPEVQG